jgi:hypothetical protein
MPRLFSSTCDNCKEVLGGPAYIPLFKRKSGEWVKLLHPGECWQIMEYQRDDELSNDEVVKRQGMSKVCFCKDCGERILASTEGTWLAANNYVGPSECKCGCKDFVPVTDLQSQDIDCPKCKKGKLHGGCFGIS